MAAEGRMALTTARLRLTELAAADLDAFVDVLAADPTVVAHFRALAGLPDRATRLRVVRAGYFDHFAAVRATWGHVNWAIRRLDGQFIGWCGLHHRGDVDDPAVAPEIGWMLARDWQGRGLMAEAAGAVVADAFARSTAARLNAVVAPANAPSLVLARRLGFTEARRLPAYGAAVMVVLVRTRPDEPKRPTGRRACCR